MSQYDTLPLAMQRVVGCVLCAYTNTNKQPLKAKIKQIQHLPKLSQTKALLASCKLFFKILHFLFDIPATIALRLAHVQRIAEG